MPIVKTQNDCNTQSCLFVKTQKMIVIDNHAYC